MESCIYIIKNNIDNKVYIGSAVNLERRIKKHFRELKNQEHHSKKFQNFYNKYKTELVLTYEVLEYCEKSSLILREQYYLDSFDYDLLLNVNKIANSRLGLSNSLEMNKKISESLKGHTHSNETKQKIRNKLTGTKLNKERIKHFMKKINQFDIEGNLMMTWDSIKSASEKLQINRSKISYCLKSPHLTLQNSYWRVFNDNEIKIEILDCKNKKKIGLLENETVIKSYNSIKEAANDLGLNPSKISNVCSGKRKHTGGYKFCYL